jgi:hypothetical protein
MLFMKFESYQLDYSAIDPRIAHARPSLLTQVASIDGLDLRALCHKAVQTEEEGGYGWSVQDALEISELYRAFLFLCLVYPSTQILPTREVDEFWHLHILDTRAYERDCQNIFGRILHHFPYAGLPGSSHASESELVEETVTLIQRHFPEIL